MAVVLDASLFLVLATNDPRGTAVERHLLQWLDDGEEVHLGRHSAYDAAYLDLAQRLGAELWTLDGSLARNAAGLGFPVRLVRG
jgi:predicted nucleic acid-binding protein